MALQKTFGKKLTKEKEKEKKWFSIPELREIKNDWRPCSTLFKTFYFPIPKLLFLFCYECYLTSIDFCYVFSLSLFLSFSLSMNYK
jgi:hypothetical protein